MLEPGLIPPAVTMAEAQAYARVETGEEEALIAGLVRSATALCESFTGQALVTRTFGAIVPADGKWQRLGVAPVRSIDTVAALAIDGTSTAMAVDQYELDIDSRGEGWARSGVGGRLKVSGTAGMASDANGVAEPLRQGILRLVAYLFAARDGEAGEPPAAVTALWRPYRRTRLA